MSYGKLERLARFRTVLSGLVRELRPGQWYKQVILFIPVVFSLNAVDPGAWIRTGAGAVLFTAVAGSVYIINDIADVEEDRQHPTKRHRPIASGQVAIPVAMLAAVLLVGTSLVAAWWLEPLFSLVLVAYVGQNLLYSFLLRQFLIVDLLVISAGFVLRAIGGVWLVGSPISPWLLLSMFLAALMLGSGKRYRELADVEDPETTRETLGKYSLEFLRFVFLGVTVMLLFAYSLYTFFARDLAMMTTIPFAFFAVFRYSYLTIEGHIDQPKELLLDREMVANFVLWGLAIIALLYVYPRVSLP